MRVAGGPTYTPPASGGAGGAVTSVAGRTGDVVLTKADVAGVTNVDNTADVDKPVSTAQAAFAIAMAVALG